MTKKNTKKTVQATETHVICPHCGQEIAISDKEHLAVGIAIGKDSGLGTVVLPPADGKQPTPPPTSNKAEARLQALRAAGIDTSGLFALKGAAGEGLLVRMGAEGAPELVPDNDPIFDAILTGGSVPERRLFRRWVMAQMYRMLERGFTESLHGHGYRYQWKQTLEELRVQATLARNDAENYAMRNRFFNRELVITMAKDYLKKLEKGISLLPEKTCKGKGYKHFDARNVYVFDIPFIIAESYHLADAIKSSDTPATLYKATKAFHDKLIILPDMKQSTAWIDAYKGAGAYFTLRNMIMFHGCALPPYVHVPDTNTRMQESLKKLEDLAEHCASKRQGYALLGVLKEAIEMNGIDIRKKRREWAEAKSKKQSKAAANA